MVKRGSQTRISIDLTEKLTASEWADLMERVDAFDGSVEEYILKIICAEEKVITDSSVSTHLPADFSLAEEVLTDDQEDGD